MYEWLSHGFYQYCSFRYMWRIHSRQRKETRRSVTQSARNHSPPALWNMTAVDEDWSRSSPHVCWSVWEAATNLLVKRDKRFEASTTVSHEGQIHSHKTEHKIWKTQNIRRNVVVSRSSLFSGSLGPTEELILTHKSFRIKVLKSEDHQHKAAII